MGEEIYINEYVRTEEGYILENIVKAHKNIIEKLVEEDREYENKYGKITKHSKNIIDLIEVGDIVFLKNIKGDEFAFKAEIHDEKTMYDFKIAIDYKEIKLLSILTHEKYEQNCYEVEG